MDDIQLSEESKKLKEENLLLRNGICNITRGFLETITNVSRLNSAARQAEASAQQLLLEQLNSLLHHEAFLNSVKESPTLLEEIKSLTGSTVEEQDEIDVDNSQDWIEWMQARDAFANSLPECTDAEAVEALEKWIAENPPPKAVDELAISPDDLVDREDYQNTWVSERVHPESDIPTGANVDIDVSGKYIMQNYVTAIGNKFAKHAQQEHIDVSQWDFVSEVHNEELNGVICFFKDGIEVRSLGNSYYLPVVPVDYDLGLYAIDYQAVVKVAHLKKEDNVVKGYDIPYSEILTVAKFMKYATEIIE